MMSREQRQALIDKLQSENAESLLDIARRETSIDDLNASTDALLARLEARREIIIEKSASTGGLIFKTTETPQPQDAATSAAWNRWLESHLVNERERMFDTIAYAISLERDTIRKQREESFSELAARVDELESRITELEARMEQTNGGYAG